MEVVKDELFPYRLRACMGLYGLSAAELGRRTGMDEGYLSRVLNGKLRPSLATQARIVLAIHGLDRMTKEPARLAEGVR